MGSVTPILWVYLGGDGWYGHVDWRNGTYSPTEGPFETEAQAAITIARVHNMEPPKDMLAQREREVAREQEGTSMNVSESVRRLVIAAMRYGFTMYPCWELEDYPPTTKQEALEEVNALTEEIVTYVEGLEAGES